jgi:hypothetical protein
MIPPACTPSLLATYISGPVPEADFVNFMQQIGEWLDWFDFEMDRRGAYDAKWKAKPSGAGARAH